MSRLAFPRLPEGIRTNCGCPWALIKRGGETPGKCPATKLAFLVDVTGVDGGRTLKIMGIMPKLRGGWTSKVFIREQAIVKQWRLSPTELEVAKERKKLMPARASQ